MPFSKTVLIQLFIIVAIVAGYFLIDINKIYTKLRGKGEFVTQDKQCDLHQTSCTIILKDGTKFTLDITPKDIPLMEELTFNVTSSKEDFDDLKIRIYSTNMLMGNFVLTLENLGNGKYQAKGILPTCPVGGMKWNADIEISTFTKVTGARFQFQTDI